MQVRVVSPDARDALTIDVDSECTLGLIRQKLQEQINFDPFAVAFFHSRRLITLSTTLPPSDGATIAQIVRARYPGKSFPVADYSLPLDFPFGRTQPSAGDFPESWIPPYLARSQGVEHTEEIVNDLADHLADPIARFVSMPQYEYREPEATARMRRAGLFRINLTKEELDEEEETNEEEDVDAFIELRDNFEEDLSPEHGAVIDRLDALGFDRMLVTPILFMSQGDERVATEFLMKALEAMP
jgi:hypothetical protein